MTLIRSCGDGDLRVFIVYYSICGHIPLLARAVAGGVEEAGLEAELYQVPETLPLQVIESMGTTAFQEEFAQVPVIDRHRLGEVDVIIFGTPTRFGNMYGQMCPFLDATGSLWRAGVLAGKVGSVFTSSSCQHGGHETTVSCTAVTPLHRGMVVAGLPYTFGEQCRPHEITGCSPYGASTVAGPDGSRWPGENELAGACYQGKYVALLTRHLARGRKKMMRDLANR